MSNFNLIKKYLKSKNEFEKSLIIQDFFDTNKDVINFIMNPVQNYNSQVPSLAVFSYVIVVILSLSAILFGTKITWNRFFLPQIRQKIRQLKERAELVIAASFLSRKEGMLKREYIRRQKKVEREQKEKQRQERENQTLSSWSVNYAMTSLLDPNEPFSMLFLTGMWTSYLTGFKVPYLQSDITWDKVFLATAAKLFLLIGFLIKRLIRREFYGEDYDPIYYRLPNAILDVFADLLFMRIKRIKLTNITDDNIEDLEKEMQTVLSKTETTPEFETTNTSKDSSEEKNILGLLRKVKTVQNAYKTLVNPDIDLNSIAGKSSTNSAEVLQNIQVVLAENQTKEQEQKTIEEQQVQEREKMKIINDLIIKNAKIVPKLKMEDLFLEYCGPIIEVSSGFGWFKSTSKILFDVKVSKAWVLISQKILEFYAKGSEYQNNVKKLAVLIDNEANDDNLQEKFKYDTVRKSKKSLYYFSDSAWDTFQKGDFNKTPTSWDNVTEELVMLNKYVNLKITKPIMKILKDIYINESKTHLDSEYPSDTSAEIKLSVDADAETSPEFYTSIGMDTPTEDLDSSQYQQNNKIYKKKTPHEVNLKYKIPIGFINHLRTNEGVVSPETAPQNFDPTSVVKSEDPYGITVASFIIENGENNYEEKKEEVLYPLTEKYKYEISDIYHFDKNKWNYIYLLNIIWEKNKSIVKIGLILCRMMKLMVLLKYSYAISFLIFKYNLKKDFEIKDGKKENKKPNNSQPSSTNKTQEEKKENKTNVTQQQLNDNVTQENKKDTPITPPIKFKSQPQIIHSNSDSENDSDSDEDSDRKPVLNINSDVDSENDSDSDAESNTKQVPDINSDVDSGNESGSDEDSEQSDTSSISTSTPTSSRSSRNSSVGVAFSNSSSRSGSDENSIELEKSLEVKGDPTSEHQQHIYEKLLEKVKSLSDNNYKNVSEQDILISKNYVTFGDAMEYFNSSKEKINSEIKDLLKTLNISMTIYLHLLGKMNKYYKEFSEEPYIIDKIITSLKKTYEIQEKLKDTQSDKMDEIFQFEKCIQKSKIKDENQLKIEQEIKKANDDSKAGNLSNISSVNKYQ
jgi:hypothetical protein